MHRKTRNDAYRREALTFLGAYEHIAPYFGWIYGMEAVLETDAAVRIRAACRARFLDPQSYFLKLADVSGVNPEACAKSLWR